MRVLLSNDDGVLAEGLHALRQELAKMAEVYVVAPDHEQSACSHSITLHRPIRAKKVAINGVEDLWVVNGTPADCVKLGLNTLIPERPDLVVSGINLGDNLGTDVLYSGTVSAAMEGAIGGLPAIAVSLEDGAGLLPFAARFTAFLCRRFLEWKPKPRTLLNVNIPNLPPNEIKGVEITSLGFRTYLKAIHQRKDPRDRTYYWIAGETFDHGSVKGTDVAAIANGSISITPIHFDLTDYESLEELREHGFGQGFDQLS